MWYAILTAIGVLLGAATNDVFGAATGGILGLIVAHLIGLEKRLQALEQPPAAPVPVQSTAPIVESIQQAVETPTVSPDVRPANDEVMTFDIDLNASEVTSEPNLPPPEPDDAVWSADLRPVPASATPRKAMPRVSLSDQIGRAVKEFFTRGNVVVRVGMVVLFFGVSFLLKFAVDKNVFPIEFRLAGLSAGALVLFWLGWKLRHTRATYALILQGGAIGVWYLIVYACAQIYELLPLSLAFVLMLVLVGATCLLAVLQNSRAFATMGAIGGFIAPILCSSGSGDHVLLFSYYAFLNIGVFAIAWFRSWRALNLLGFIFTFGIATVWGVLEYKPSLFDSTEPFLVLFFLLYLIISILYALKQPPNLRGFIDSTLVFGLPLVTIVLQAMLVRNMEFGLAWSAVAMSATYLTAAAFLWRLRDRDVDLLTRAFVALGIIFATLAVPSALDGRWTSITWSVEGAAMVWIGIHQRRIASRLFGLLLQIGAGFYFFVAINENTNSDLFINGLFMGSIILSISGLFVAWNLYRWREQLSRFETFLQLPIMFWGLAWWFGGFIHEIANHVTNIGNHQPSALLTLFVATMCLFTLLGARLRWTAVRWAVVVLLPIVVLISFGEVGDSSMHLFADWGFAVWLLSFAALFWLLAAHEKHWPSVFASTWYIVTLWLLVFVLSAESLWLVDKQLQLNLSWSHAIMGLIPALIMLVLSVFGHHVRWPIQHYAKETFGIALGAVAAVLAIWFSIVSFFPSHPSPLTYVPIANPLDLVQLTVLVVIGLWFWNARKHAIPSIDNMPVRLPLAVLGCGLFVWLNVVLARCIHVWYDIPYDADRLFDSATLQGSIAILWTTTAFALMVVSKRFVNRSVWMLGAALLAVVIAKLFLIDLSGTGTVARIVTFLGVGVMMLVIGYLAPLPPSEPTEKTS